MSDVTIASSEYIPAKKRLQKIAADAYQRAWGDAANLLI